MKIFGLSIRGAVQGASRVTMCKTSVRVLSKVQNEVWSWCPCRWSRHRKWQGPLAGEKSVAEMFEKSSGSGFDM